MIVIGLVTLSGCADAPPAPVAERHDPPLVRPVTGLQAPDPVRPRLPDGRTVKGAVRRAHLAGHIGRRQFREYRELDRRARRALRRLSGQRRAELGAVVGTLDGIAAAQRLTASRMPLAFLTLRRNIEVWANRRSLPAPGERLTFGRDPVVFQAFAGQGVQHHPLASFGRANALARPCLHESRRRCRPRALGRMLDRLVTLSSRRGGAVAWEYFFAYGGGGPLWVSGMSQGTAVQALARGARVLRRARYLRTAESALATFERPPPEGVAVSAPGGRHYLMYSFNPDLRILNGFLQSVIGLHDLARISGAARARRAYAAGEGAARVAVQGYDTGAWSLYASGGRESNESYHRLVHEFLIRLCARTRRQVYCGAERRFGRYLTEPPRIGLAVSPRTRARRTVPIDFTLSKIAHVAVRVTGPRGTALRRTMTLARGRHQVSWVPDRRGAYRVRVDATGLSGPRGVARSTIRVKPLPRTKPRKRVVEPRTVRKAPARRRPSRDTRADAREQRPALPSPAEPDPTATPEPAAP